MTPLNISFLYPQLPIGVDAIRILTVEPGDFLDDLKCTLTPVAFGSRPKYVALSYTWGSSYPNPGPLPLDNTPGLVSPPPRHWRSEGGVSDRPFSRSHSREPSTGEHQAVPLSPKRLTSFLPRQRTVSMQSAPSKPDALAVNNHPFEVGHNLHLALRHLRSLTHPVSIWADAICINQFDEKERNQQVSLMSFIYTRAKMVVAWLGPKKYRDLDTAHGTTALRPMFFDWKSGQAQYFAAAVAGDSKMRCSSKPDLGVFVRITESTYWTRLWIVQEVCLPRSLVFLYGSDIWTYDEFRSWDHLSCGRGATLGAADRDRLEPMLRLMASRDGRHSEMMTLERVIERFARNECSELRDRVYGLLGCANDIDAFVGHGGSERDSLAEHIDELTLEGRPLPELPRGRGRLEVDYSRSFYDIWSGVVEAIYSKGKTTKFDIPFLVSDEQCDKAVDAQEAALSIEVRLASIVRTAGVVQDAFGQAVERELDRARLRDEPVGRTLISLSRKMRTTSDDFTL